MPALHTRAARKPAHTPVKFPELQLPRLELLFRDGSSTWMHQVTSCTYVRGIDVDGERIEIDLREISPHMEGELHDSASHDRAGLMFFTLRHQFPTLEAFLAAVRNHREAAHG